MYVGAGKLISSNLPVVKSILTEREIEYLSLVALGYKNFEIAKVLTVTCSTVKKTLENIFEKLSAKDRTNAVTLAFIHKMLDIIVLNNIILKYNLENNKEV